MEAPLYIIEEDVYIMAILKQLTQYHCEGFMFDKRDNRVDCRGGYLVYTEAQACAAFYKQFKAYRNVRGKVNPVIIMRDVRCVALYTLTLEQTEQELKRRKEKADA